MKEFAMRYLLVLTGLIVAIGISGCTPPPDPMLDLIDVDLRKTKVDDLSRTMDFVFSDRRFEQKEFESKIASGLNRWAAYSDNKLETVDWQLDPLAQPLLKQFEGLAILDRTSELSFVNADAYFLQESAWVDQIFKRVTESKQLNAFELYRLSANDFRPDEDQDPVVEIVKKLNDGLDGKSAKQLAYALKYFDWICRNIQLLPDVEHDADEIDDLRLNDKEDWAAAGVPGTGYQRYPWQTLLYARGDFVDRAKLFMIGLQQQGIHSVMLAVKSEGADERQPWVVAIPFGKEYFLFDTRMALPIPGETPGAIATLSAIRANPELIDGLDLTVEESLEDDTKYWVKSDQLEDLAGWVYVAPESFSRRMKVLESRLIDDERLNLVLNPAEVVERLPETEGLDVKIWNVAFKTHQFRQAVREALEDTENNVILDRLKWHFQNENYVDSFTRYRTGRARFFVGKFESSRNSTGLNAIESFEHLMYSDETIDSLATDSKLQTALGILSAEGADAADFNFRLKNVQSQMRLVRRDTGLFLAQSHFDNGSVSAAANWLKLLKEKEGSDRWRDEIDYLLGRSLEARQEYDLAIEQYRENKKSTQAHGNLIRARLLTNLIEKLEAKVESEEGQPDEPDEA